MTLRLPKNPWKMQGFKVLNTMGITLKMKETWVPMVCMIMSYAMISGSRNLNQSGFHGSCQLFVKREPHIFHPSFFIFLLINVLFQAISTSGQFITTFPAEVTPNGGGLVRESLPKCP